MQSTMNSDPLKHEMVYNRLVSTITEDNYQVGDQLPSERALAEKLNVNMATVRRAFKELIVSGIVEKRIGSGTYLVQPINADWYEKPINVVVAAYDGGPVQREVRMWGPLWINRHGRKCRMVFANKEEFADLVRSYIRYRQPTILLAIDTEEVRAEIAKAPELFVILAVRLDQAGIPSVLCDDNHGIRTLMEHLKHRGHKRIALFHSHNGLPLEEVQGAVWKTCLGTNYSPELNICANVCAEKEPMDSAYEAMLTAAAAVDFSAVLCLNDEIMLGGMAALRKLGRDIPKDVSVVSVGNTHLSRYAHPPVTCYDPNLEEHLNQAIMLLDYNYGNPDNLDKLRLVNPVLIERDSVTKQSE